MYTDDLERGRYRVSGTKVPREIEFSLGIKILGFVFKFMPLGMKMNLSLTFKTKLWYPFTSSFQFSDVHTFRFYMRGVDGRLCANGLRKTGMSTLYCWQESSSIFWPAHRASQIQLTSENIQRYC